MMLQIFHNRYTIYVSPDLSFSIFVLETLKFEWECSQYLGLIQTCDCDWNEKRRADTFLLFSHLKNCSKNKKLELIYWYFCFLSQTFLNSTDYMSSSWTEWHNSCSWAGVVGYNYTRREIFTVQVREEGNQDRFIHWPALSLLWELFALI